jgi:hypothetical protein
VISDGIQGVDYSFSRPTATRLKAAGKQFAVRYLSTDTPGAHGKILFRGEANALAAAGIWIVSNWEFDVGDWKGGFNAGVNFAREAARQHTAAGGPAGRPIYFSVDSDVSAAQLAGPITQYFKGIISVIGLDRTGVYGGIEVVDYLAQHHLASWFWQTYAWSDGRWSAHNNAEQYDNGVTVAGATVDLDRAKGPDYGQWQPGKLPTDARSDFMAALSEKQQADLYFTIMNVPNPSAAGDGRSPFHVWAKYVNDQLALIKTAALSDDADENAIVSGVLTGLASRPVEDAAAALKAVYTPEKIAALITALSKP